VVRVRGADALPVDLRALHEQPLRPDLADDPADVAAELEARHQLAVRVAQEAHVGDADLLRRGALLVLPDAGDVLARDGRVEAARVAVRAEQVRHLDALVDPGRDRRRRAEVDVVRVGHDGQCSLNVHAGSEHDRDHVVPCGRMCA
jgi:hypothetical protein